MGNYKPQDHFFKKAKQDQFVARSVYKLEELDRRFSLFKRGLKIVDLGAAPGSWAQYIAKAIGKKGRLIGYDLEPLSVNPGPNAVAFQRDVMTLEAEQVLQDLAEALQKPMDPRRRIDAIVSDMAPKLTGIRDADQAKSAELVENGLRLADALVKEGGFFVAKLFQGRDTDEVVQHVKVVFKEVKLLKPEATREGSREVFVLGRARRPL